MSAPSAPDLVARAPGLSIIDLLGWLSGEWHVQRTINAVQGRFSGTARFTPRDGSLTWEEVGRLWLGAHAGPARRTLLVEPLAGPRGRVCFDDGRPFHELDLSSGRWDADHSCGPDTYRGVFAVLGTDSLSVRWRVIGPERDDVIASRYDRRHLLR